MNELTTLAVVVVAACTVTYTIVTMIRNKRHKPCESPPRPRRRRNCWPVYRGWRYREAAVIGRNWQLCRAGIHSVELARRNAGQYQRLHVEQLGRP